MQRVWSLGSVNLNPGVLRLIQWSPIFSPSSYRNTFARVWVRFWDLGFVYWEHQTLFEIARGVGMPVKLDPRTVDRSLGLYARILVEVDLSRPLLHQLRVFRAEGDSVFVRVKFESTLDVCSSCGLVGHLVTACKVRVPSVEAGIPLSRGRTPVRKRRNRRRKSQSPKFLLRRPPSPEPIVQQAVISAPLLGSTLAAVVSLVQDSHAAISLAPEPILKVDNSVVAPLVDVALSVSSSASVPPGFVVKRSVLAVNQVVPPINCATGDPVPLSLDGSELEVTSSPVPDESQEEGEFTPVLTKKTKKKLKLKVKAMTKPSSRVPPCTLLSKSAKHRRFI